MGDSRRQRPRSPYAQPGEIDTALVERESLRPSTAAKPNLRRSTPTALPNISESTPTAGLNAEREPKRSASGHVAKSMPSPLRSGPPTNLMRGLAPPPGIASTPSVPLRPVGIHTLTFGRTHAPPPPLISELKQVREN